MGELGALFNPGMRHELEERQAKAARREEEGNAKDGDLRIDLESGVAVINAPGESGAGQGPETAGGRPAGESGAADDTGAQPERPADREADAGGEHARATGSGAPDEFDGAGEPVDAHSPAKNPDRESNRAAGPPAADKQARSAPPADQPAGAVRPRGKRGVSAAR